mgnify:CR=1 FL=1
MKSRPSAARFANPFLLWGTPGLKALQMSAAAAQVIAIRGARMAAAGPNPGAASDAAARPAHRALAPVHRTATANARRLATKKAR